MMRKRSLQIALGLAVAGAVFCLAFWDGQKQYQSRRITPLVSVGGWQRGYGDVLSGEPYLWLTDHELLHFENTPRGTEAFSYDTQTHKDVPEPRLNAVQAGRVASASPDGQWVLWHTQKDNVLWHTQRDNRPPASWAATRRRDGKTVRWPNSQKGFWLPDSRRWMGLDLHDVDHPGLRLPLCSDPGSWLMGDVLGVNTRGHVIVSFFSDLEERPGQPAFPLSLAEVSLTCPRATGRRLSVPHPRAGLDCSILLSPQGDRLLWINVSQESSATDEWLSSWTGNWYESTMSLDVWVCHLDGTPPKHVGTWRGRKTSYPASVRWNPDGRHVSFTLEDTLYSVPVD